MKIKSYYREKEINILDDQKCYSLGNYMGQVVITDSVCNQNINKSISVVIEPHELTNVIKACLFALERIDGSKRKIVRSF